MKHLPSASLRLAVSRRAGLAAFGLAALALAAASLFSARSVHAQATEPQRPGAIPWGPAPTNLPGAAPGATPNAGSTPSAAGPAGLAMRPPSTQAAGAVRYTTGRTGVSDIALQRLTGNVSVDVTPDQQRIHNAMAQQSLARYLADRAQQNQGREPSRNAACRPDAASFDWRSQGVVTPVKFQDRCGSCWAFATVAAVESSMAVQGGVGDYDGSEQQLLNNVPHFYSAKEKRELGACEGNTINRAADYLVANGTVSEATRPYRAMPTSAVLGEPTPYDAVTWGWVPPPMLPAAPGVAPMVDAPAYRAALKQALCEHGPLAITMYVDEKSKKYTGGPLTAEVPKDAGPNHAVLLIGWNEARQTWIIKNSWGTDWGETVGIGRERGYAQVEYSAPLFAKNALWITAKAPLRGVRTELPPAVQLTPQGTRPLAVDRVGATTQPQDAAQPTTSTVSNAVPPSPIVRATQQPGAMTESPAVRRPPVLPNGAASAPVLRPSAFGGNRLP